MKLTNENIHELCSKDEIHYCTLLAILIYLHGEGILDENEYDRKIELLREIYQNDKVEIYNN